MREAGTRRWLGRAGSRLAEKTQAPRRILSQMTQWGVTSAHVCVHMRTHTNVFVSLQIFMKHLVLGIILDMGMEHGTDPGSLGAHVFIYLYWL